MHKNDAFIVQYHKKAWTGSFYRNKIVKMDDGFVHHKYNLHEVLIHCVRYFHQELDALNVVYRCKNRKLINLGSVKSLMHKIF